MIQRFYVEGMFGFRNVDIKFEDTIKILIANNGAGKTTILNLLYYILEGLYERMLEINFDKIELTVLNQDFSFSKEDIIGYVEYERNMKSRIPLRVRNYIEKYIDNFLPIERKKIKRDQIEKMIIEKNIPRFAPIHIMVREIQRYFQEYKNNDVIRKFEVLKSLIKQENINILYLPTYRRVEEELKKIGNIKITKRDPFDDFFIEESIEGLELEGSLIHFGMQDVEKSIEKITSLIREATVNGFSRITAEILAQLLKGFENNVSNNINEFDKTSVEIVLHRLGSNISENEKNNILELIENKDSLKEKKELVFFINKLIEIYNSLKEYDNAIKTFCEVCNSYLYDKEFLYNESSVEVGIFRKKNKAQIELSNLSSGEKQIVSIFSRVYLENIDEKNIKYIVLFDEPELSLSLNWQKQLLPDLLKSNKCSFLLSVTHSPFIFENELDEFAVSMDKYIIDID